MATARAQTFRGSSVRSSSSSWRSSMVIFRSADPADVDPSVRGPKDDARPALADPALDRAGRELGPEVEIAPDLVLGGVRLDDGPDAGFQAEDDVASPGGDSDRIPLTE